MDFTHQIFFYLFFMKAQFHLFLSYMKMNDYVGA